jgi:hypothetical protein
VHIADPEGTAKAALELLNNPEKWRAAQQAGLARVKRYYDDQLVFSSYREVFSGALGGPRHPAVAN